jgi:hypothetical protein
VENLAVNEGARSFLYQSNRDRTPLGHNHRAHLRDFSIGEIREMYREAVKRMVDQLGDLTDEYERSLIVTAQNTLTLLQKQTGVG